MNKPTVSIVLDKRRMSTKGDNKDKYHIKVRVTFKVRVGDEKRWIKKMYQTGFYASVDDFKKIMNNPRTTEHRDIHDKLFKLLKKAKGIIEDNTYINEDLFERQFTGSGGHDNLLKYFQEIIDENEAAGNVGNASVYRTAMNDFKRFGGESINFYEITKKWLDRYSKWKDDKQTTLASNLRCLRAVFNRVITDKKVPADLYPFARNTHDRGKFQISIVVGTKYALSEVELSNVLSFKSEDPAIMKALAFWKFSFLCYGINMADILRLKFKDIDNDVISIIRYKTRNTNKVKRKMMIPIPEEAKDIILKYGNRSLNPDDYVFPVIIAGMTARQEMRIIQDFLKKVVNAGLKKIGKDLALPFKFTFYIARHTFATLAVIRGASLTFVMEALGHTSPKTTLNYFHGFDIGTKKRISGLISST